MSFTGKHAFVSNTEMSGFGKIVHVFNPIPAGVLENQDMLGGGVNLTPPPLNPMFDVQI